VAILVLLLVVILSLSRFGAGPGTGTEGATAPANSPSPAVQDTPADRWAALFQRTPFPYMTPLPPPTWTVLDGTYAKFNPRPGTPVPCRRCPDYAPEGGIWKLNFDKGIFRIFYEVTGWRSIASFTVSGDQLLLFNDANCWEVVGVYTWKLEGGQLTLQVVEDECVSGLRAMNLTELPWLSCQPPNREAAITEHWPKPTGCP
jgi:hypothetical protein